VIGIRSASALRQAVGDLPKLLRSDIKGHQSYRPGQVALWLPGSCDVKRQSLAFFQAALASSPSRKTAAFCDTTSDRPVGPCLVLMAYSRSIPRLYVGRSSFGRIKRRRLLITRSEHLLRSAPILKKSGPIPLRPMARIAKAHRRQPQLPYPYSACFVACVGDPCR
jgi:hypothetical protein